MNSVELIAEIGINHDGSIEKCKKLIDGSNHSGCKYIKFQYRNLNRSYHSEKEIGDEILRKEINRCFIKPQDLINLTEYAKSLGLFVGISFFCSDDINDFKKDLKKFDFFKIPSPEMNNTYLIDKLLNLDKTVFCSTGAHSQSDIDILIKRYKGQKNLIPMHCVSNYPLEAFNSIIGYIRYLKKIWGGKVGYSSHDKDQIGCIVAASMGADYIERHVTLDINSDGLDHSTSSNLAKFKLLNEQLKLVSYQRLGDNPRIINQGEIINLQNLGRSFYAIKNFKKGYKINDKDFEYRSPRTGLGFKEFKNYLGKEIYSSISKGEVLSEYHFKKPAIKNFDISGLLNKKINNISLPVRLHDIEKIRKIFNISSYECHLSFGEVLNNKDLNLFLNDESYSIHIPDYISSTQLIDPFSENKSTKEKSILLIKKTHELGTYLYNLTGKKIIIVGSFSIYKKSKKEFYYSLKKLHNQFSDYRVELCFQLLPPFAWYFGGSIKVDIFDSMEDYKLISDLNLKICTDLSHLLMSSYYYNFDPEKAFELIENNSVHFHISGADGPDGEGKGLEHLKNNEKRILDKMIFSDKLCVIEVWQGHLNGFNGFKEEIEYINKVYS
ncbi:MULTISPECIES: N-acetylneuraminate synthase family protein [Prochlorococcus]|uniref:N-acetylneuraminate synthase n=1 Tax=Prochlorococcus marinus str. MIT 9116 TaxID=167544 RepID=A0A0A1ZUN4_PROMR|nr:N-acetylneuraminate synthase family protein [Prochlorococcus marinus]KGF91724.1 N-acetylneuraminate synthase [Prochlorococcus marinus str. MIT 9107]KGF93090.1 N-acetylneuraminate synthase [Prochlorococcus marinus str. MIT 9116]KGF95089.1 N-acetylneuraminate synthase [Prochlorococcus marinus str. MIT 9123]